MATDELRGCAGVLNCALLGWDCARRLVALSRSRTGHTPWLRCALAVLACAARCAFAAAPFFAFQLWGWYRFCGGGPWAGAHLRPWCTRRPGLIYTFVQEHYWCVSCAIRVCHSWLGVALTHSAALLQGYWLPALLPRRAAAEFRAGGAHAGGDCGGRCGVLARRPAPRTNAGPRHAAAVHQAARAHRAGASGARVHARWCGSCADARVSAIFRRQCVLLTSSSGARAH